MRMYPRSEFPVEKPPLIVSAEGRISARALKTHFSALGCPQASPTVAVALIKDGHSPSDAIRLAMLACHIKSLSMDCIERTAAAITAVAEKNHADRFPTGKCAEDRAARRENRPSRWGTRQFHGVQS